MGTTDSDFIDVEEKMLCPEWIQTHSSWAKKSTAQTIESQISFEIVLIMRQHTVTYGPVVFMEQRQSSRCRLPTLQGNALVQAPRSIRPHSSMERNLFFFFFTVSQIFLAKLRQ